MKHCFVFALLSATLVNAQTALPTEYPEGALALAGDAIKEQLAGKAFTAKPSDGNTLRFQFKDDGYAFLDTSRGYRDTGKWRVDANNWCTDWQKTGSSCSELRRKGDVFYYKRPLNGEVVPMTLRLGVTKATESGYEFVHSHFR